MDSKIVRLPNDVSQEELETVISELNNSENISGILLQLPLPKHLNSDKALECISPSKDVDCLTKQNLGALFAGKPVVSPCTATGIIKILDHQNIEIEGKRAVVIGRSLLVGKSVAKAQKDSQIVFIVDFSNSMNDIVDGKAKVEMARATLAEILPKIPPNIKTGLRVYGHKTGFTYYQGCQASTLSVPLASGNYQNILNSLYSTNAVGWTPITYSLKQAINNDFHGVKGKKHIILLTDGGENCDESPCTYVIELMKTRDDVVIDVIAFDVHDIEANNQLRCTALMTSGKFLNADNERDLSNSLFETVGIQKDVRGSIKIQEK